MLGLSADSQPFLSLLKAFEKAVTARSNVNECSNVAKKELTQAATLRANDGVVAAKRSNDDDAEENENSSAEIIFPIFHFIKVLKNVRK